MSEFYEPMMQGHMMAPPGEVSIKPSYEELERKIAILESRASQHKYTVLETIKERDEALLQVDFLRKYLNPADLRFRNMIDIFMTLSDDQKEKIIALVKSLKDVQDAKA